MSQSSVGSVIVGQLEAHDVPRVYCVPGESYLDVLDSLLDSPVQTIVCRQEGGAGFMAIAEARLTGRPGVAMVTRGPGAANAAIAVHTASQDATPLVLFVGLIPIGSRHREAFQEFDLGGWFGSTAKKVLTIDVGDRAADMVTEAFHLAGSGRPGPVVVGLPEDILVERVASAPPSPRVIAAGAVSAEQGALLQSYVDGAQRPLVIVGGDRWTADSAREFTNWCRRRGMAMVTDWRCHDIIDHADPGYVGWLGYGRADSVRGAMDEADLLIYVGCGYGDVASDGYRSGDAEAVTVVVDPDPTLSSHQRRVDLHLLATPPALTAALADLSAGADGRSDTVDLIDRPAGRADWVAGLRAAYETFATPGPDGGRGVELGLAMSVLRDRMEPDALLTFGAGNHTRWAQRFLPRHRYPSALAPRSGAMGFGLPAGVAASLVFPGRQVVTVTGDGCFLMNGQELATATAYGATPLILLVDNSQYGTIRQHQEKHYPGRISGTALVNPDFAAFAEAFGGYGERVETSEEFPDALDRALASGRLALLHLITDPTILGPTMPGNLPRGE